MENIARDERSPGLVPLYRTMWRHAAGDRRRVAGFMALLVAAQLVTLSIPYFAGNAVNAMQGSGVAGLETAAWDMLFIFIACLASWALHGPGRVLERRVAIGIRQRFADSLYAKVVGLPLAWHERHHSGETIERVAKAGDALFGFSQYQFLYLQNAVSVIGPIVAIFLLSVPTGLAAIAGYAVIGFVLVRFDSLMVQLNRQQNQAEARYNAALVDCIGNIATVLTLRLQEATRRLVGARLDDAFLPLRRSIVMNETKWFVIDVLNNALRCGLAVLYAWLAWRGNGTVLLGSAVMVYQYAQQAGGVVSSMAANYQDLVRFETDLAAADPIVAAEGGSMAGAGIPADWRVIAVDGLNFAFSGMRGDIPALRQVSLLLERGRRIALVGESGAGKSTLLRVLLGLYPPQHAAIAVDGVPRPDLRHLGAIATLVPQDPEIFEGSIGHNVTLGIDYPLQEVIHSCHLACFAEVVDQLPHGLATGIAERGLNLSGGQKQRLALARGILAARSSSLLMLDEPTSSLDPETEGRVYDNLLAAFPDSCIVSSIHRLHLLSRFDRVVFMADGEIVDVGAAAELLQRQPRFKALWERYAGTSEAAESSDSIAA